MSKTFVKTRREIYKLLAHLTEKFYQSRLQKNNFVFFALNQKVIFLKKIECGTLEKRSDRMHWLWVIIVGSVIGSIAGAITGEKRGCLFNITAGIIGSSIGESLFDAFGPRVAGMALVPSILGAVIFVAIVSFIFGKSK